MLSQKGLILTYEAFYVIRLNVKVPCFTKVEFLTKKTDISVRFITFVIASNISTPQPITCF